MGQRQNCSSSMEVSYCTFGFGAIIRHNLCTLSLLHDSPIYVRDLSPRGKGNSCLMKLFGWLSYQKIRRYNNSPPYVTARWPPQQIPPLDFLECSTSKGELCTCFLKKYENVKNKSRLKRHVFLSINLNALINYKKVLLIE